MSGLNAIDDLIRPVLEDMGFRLVRVLLLGNHRKTLQIMAERADESGMSVEDCAKVSRAISAVLDVEDPISEAYTLEVSSPGIDRPLVSERDFERFSGFDCKVEMEELLESRRKFSGKLLGIEGGMVKIDMEGEVFSLPFADIRRAKLILTDALLEASAKKQGL